MTPQNWECALFLVSNLIPQQREVSLRPVVSFLPRPSRWQMRTWTQVDRWTVKQKMETGGICTEHVLGG